MFWNGLSTRQQSAVGASPDGGAIREPVMPVPWVRHSKHAFGERSSTGPGTALAHPFVTTHGRLLNRETIGALYAECAFGARRSARFQLAQTQART